MSLDLLRRQVRERQALPAPQERKALRLGARVSLESLASSVGVSRETARLWELGRVEPSLRHIPRYLQALDVLRGGDDRAR
jgi:transcriptional regulator with XRE-family HTH domain